MLKGNYNMTPVMLNFNPWHALISNSHCFRQLSAINEFSDQSINEGLKLLKPINEQIIFIFTLNASYLVVTFLYIASTSISSDLKKLY